MFYYLVNNVDIVAFRNSLLLHDYVFSVLNAALEEGEVLMRNSLLKSLGFRGLLN